MFERTRIKYDENTGVRTTEKYNPIKEALHKIGEKAGTAIEFVSENGTIISVALGTGFVVWLVGVNNGIDLVNTAMLEGWKEDGYMGRGDGLIFKKKMSFAEWMEYLDHMYNTKKGKKRKNINKYLKERGFID
jgi:hypothetical protein